MLIESQIEDGFVSKVSTDENIEHEVIVLMGGKPERAINTRYDATIRDRRSAAREQSQLMGIGLAVDIAVDALLELSRTTFKSPAEATSAINGAVQALSDSLQTVMVETPPPRMAAKRPVRKTKGRSARQTAAKTPRPAGGGKRRSRRAATDRHPQLSVSP